MCGRYVLTIEDLENIGEAIARYEQQLRKPDYQSQVFDSYNIAPSNEAPVLLQDKDGKLNKIHLREPFMVKLTPFLKGIMPARLYDFVAGKVFKVYDSLNTFIGRNQQVK